MGGIELNSLRQAGHGFIEPVCFPENDPLIILIKIVRVNPYGLFKMSERAVGVALQIKKSGPEINMRQGIFFCHVQGAGKKRKTVLPILELAPGKCREGKDNGQRRNNDRDF